MTSPFCSRKAELPSARVSTSQVCEMDIDGAGIQLNTLGALSLTASPVSSVCMSASRCAPPGTMTPDDFTARGASHTWLDVAGRGTDSFSATPVHCNPPRTRLSRILPSHCRAASAVTDAVAPGSSWAADAFAVG